MRLFFLQRVSGLIVLVSGGFAAAQNGVTIVPPHSGPNTANLHPPVRPVFERPISNPVIYTHPFPIGVNYGGSICSPFLFNSGGGHYVQYGYPYPLDLSFHNLQPGHMVSIPAPAWWGTRYQEYPLTETQRRVDESIAALPVAPSAAAPVPLAPPVDEGRGALRARDYGRAIAIYLRRDAEQRDLEAGMVTGKLIDRTAERLLAVAYVGAGRLSEAARALADAQADDASLAARPVDGDDLIASPREQRRLVTEAVKFANRNPSSQAWELVAVLMEAEGRPQVAALMRQRGSQPSSPPSARPVPAPLPAAIAPASFTMPSPGE